VHYLVVLLAGFDDLAPVVIAMPSLQTVTPERNATRRCGRDTLLAHLKKKTKRGKGKGA
jgi:hypothetical protein